MMEILSKSSFKYKSSVLGKADTTVGNNRLLKKKCKKSCSTKIFKQFLQIIRDLIE